MTAPTCLLNLGWSLQRAAGGEQPYWAAIAVAAMTGQIGKPGGGFAFGMGSVNSVGQPVRPLRAPGLDQGHNPVNDFIPVAAIAYLLENPGGTLEYNGATLDLPDIRLVYWAGGNPFHHHSDLNWLRCAWQRPETVIVHEPVWTATAQHADIVLPTTLPFERDDIVVSSQDRTMVMNRALTAAYGQARDDHAICAAIAAELGLEERFTENRGVEDWLRHLYAGYQTRFPELPDYARLRELSGASRWTRRPTPRAHTRCSAISPLTRKARRWPRRPARSSCFRPRSPILATRIARLIRAGSRLTNGWAARQASAIRCTCFRRSRPTGCTASSTAWVPAGATRLPAGKPP